MPKTLDHTITRIPVDAAAYVAADRDAARAVALEIALGLLIGITLCAAIIFVL